MLYAYTIANVCKESSFNFKEQSNNQSIDHEFLEWFK